MIVYLQHGHGTDGPFRTESVESREDWRPQPRRGNVTAARIMVLFDGRWRRVYSDRSVPVPHFIRYHGGRIAVTGVAP